MITRRLPLFLSAVFLAITLARVANLTAGPLHAGLLGWLYAAGLGVAVYSAAYWTRVQTTRRSAALALAFFVVVDCFFNLADVLLIAETITTWLLIAAWVYGLFPTLAVGLLGLLQAQISRLPPVHAQTKTSAGAIDALHGLVQTLTARVQNMTPDKQAPTPTVNPLACPVCGVVLDNFDNPKARAGHISHHSERRNGHRKAIKETVA